MDFSDKNFVDSCQIVTGATSTEVYCYSASAAFNQILLVSVVLVVVIFGAIKLLNLRKK